MSGENPASENDPDHRAATEGRRVGPRRRRGLPHGRGAGFVTDLRRDPGESNSHFRRRLARAREYNVIKRAAALSSGNLAPVVARPLPDAGRRLVAAGPIPSPLDHPPATENTRLCAEKAKSRAPVEPEDENYVGPTWRSSNSPQYRENIWGDGGRGYFDWSRVII